MNTGSLTSPQGSDALMQPVGLAGLVLTRVLVYNGQVLVPVAPVHLIHPDTPVGYRLGVCVCMQVCERTWGEGFGSGGSLLNT